MTDFVFTLLSAVIITNLVLQWPLSVDPLRNAARAVGIARSRLHALGIATLWLMVCSTLLSYLLYRYGLVPFGLGYLRLFVFLPTAVLLITPSLALLSKLLPTLPFDGLWPLLLGNAGVLGLAVLSTQVDRGLVPTLGSSLGAGLGFWLVLCLFDDLRQRIQPEDVPLPFRGAPIDLISIGLMGLAFLGFTGLIKP